MNLSWSAKEHRMLRKLEHLKQGWNESMAYQPLPEPQNGTANGLTKGANVVGKGIHELVTVFDSAVHQLIDPNAPKPLGTGPMRRSRRTAGTTINRVFSGDIIKKPIRTLATAAYETVFELPQSALLDIPETLSGNTSSTRYNVQKTLAA